MIKPPTSSQIVDFFFSVVYFFGWVFWVEGFWTRIGRDHLFFFLGVWGAWVFKGLPLVFWEDEEVDLSNLGLFQK